MSSMRFPPFAILALFLLTALPLSAAPKPPDPEDSGLSAGERVQALVDRVKYEQEHIETLAAHFVQRKESMLFLEPEESEGSFSFQEPDKVLWEFTAPNPTLILIRGQEMLTWYRDLGRAERVSIGRQSNRVFKFLSAANSLETLQRYFFLKVTFPEDQAAPYRLELEPRYERVAKRLQSMSLEVDREGYYPTWIRYVEPDGDVTEFRFEDVEINGEIPAERFEVTLPADVEVTTVDLES